MKRLTRWMVRRFLPGHVLIEKADTEEYFRELAKKHMPGFHIHRDPQKKQKAVAEAKNVSTD